MTTSNRWKIALLLAVPVGLYFVLAAQMSWRPRIIETGWSVEDVVFSSDGKSLAIGGSGMDRKKNRTVVGPYSKVGMAGVWDVGNGKRLQLVKADCGTVIHVALSPDKRKLSGICWEEITGFVWEVPTSKLLRSDYGKMGGKNALHCLSWARYNWSQDDWLFDQRLRSPDGSLTAVGNIKSLKLFDTKTGKLLRTMNGHTALITSVAFSPDGSTLATGSWDETVMLWRIK